MKKTLAITAILVLAGGPATAAEGPSTELLSFTCAGCHGTDGSSVGPSSPSIAGLDPEYFINVMLDYKEAGRDSTIMTRLAKGYTEDQIEAMAHFFAEQKLQTYPQEHDAALVKVGKELHEDYCEKCHEDGGRDPESGILAAQWKPYMRFSMEDFQNGAREQPKKMKSKVDALMEKKGEEGIEALLHFYASQN